MTRAKPAASNPPIRSMALRAPPIMARRPSLSRYSGPEANFLSSGSAKSGLASPALLTASAPGTSTGVLSTPLMSAITRPSSSSYSLLSSIALFRNVHGTARAACGVRPSLLIKLLIYCIRYVIEQMANYIVTRFDLFLYRHLMFALLHAF